MLKKIKNFFERTEVIWSVLITFLFGLFLSSGCTLIPIWKNYIEPTTLNNTIFWVGLVLNGVFLLGFSSLGYYVTALKEFHLNNKTYDYEIIFWKKLTFISLTILILLTPFVLGYSLPSNINVLCSVGSSLTILFSFVGYWKGYFDFQKLYDYEKKALKEDLEGRILSRKNKKLKRGKDKC